MISRIGGRQPGLEVVPLYSLRPSRGLNRSGRVLLIGPHPGIEESDARDGTSFGFELPDPESEWGLLWTAMDWVLGRPITDTTLTSVASPFPAGRYFIRMFDGRSMQTRSVMLLR